MISKVDLTTVRSVAVEGNKIIIIGDGVFRSRMVTTEEGKNSNFVIQGQPSVKYKAQGYSVKFIITPHSLLGISENSPEEDKKSVRAYNERITKEWERSIVLAKQLKKGGEVSFFIRGGEVVFNNGRLILVSGSGNIPNQQVNK